MDTVVGHPVLDSKTWQNGKIRHKSLNSKRRHPSPEEEDEKLLRREKNRIAARDSRARKLQCLTNLQKDLTALKNANADIENQLSQVQAKASVVQQDHNTLKEQIEVISETWEPAERPILDSVMESILAISELNAQPRKQIAAMLESKIFKQAFEKQGSTASLRVGGLEEDTHGLKENRASLPCTRDAASFGRGHVPSSKPKEHLIEDLEAEFPNEQEAFTLPSPTLGGFRSPLPSNSPFSWLFY